MDAFVLPPFTLTNRFNPITKARVYMNGQIEGRKQFVTNVTCHMSKDFVTIMNQVLKEAREGKFSTKAEAVRRRDVLVNFFNDGGEDVN